MIYIIVGPTAAGKTKYSLELADSFVAQGFETLIINADSRQLYADFPIISAQPNAEELARHQHLLFGYLNIEDKMSAAKWANTVNDLINAPENKNKKLIIVGGTGLYIKVLLHGIAEIPEIPFEQQNKIIEAWQKDPLKVYAELTRVDPDYAKLIHYNDKQRLARALAVFYTTQKSFSAWHKETKPIYCGKYERYLISKPLKELSLDIYKRTDLMLKAGALEEAQKAYTKNPNTSLPAWSSIGCKELALYIEKQLSLDECLALWNKNTRAYAKRQITWFNYN